MGSINSRPLKAFVRFDGSGRIVAGSLILRKNKPKVGKWKEIPAYECCNPTTTSTTTSVPTTTTSTTAAPTTTTTTTAVDSLVRTANLFIDCPGGCDVICAEPLNYFDVYMTPFCIEFFPSLGCGIWLNIEGTVAFPNGIYNLDGTGCITITDGIITDVPTTTTTTTL